MSLYSMNLTLEVSFFTAGPNCLKTAITTEPDDIHSGVNAHPDLFVHEYEPLIPGKLRDDWLHTINSFVRQKTNS